MKAVFQIQINLEFKRLARLRGFISHLLKHIFIISLMFLSVSCAEKSPQHHAVEEVMKRIELSDSAELVPGSDVEIESWTETVETAENRLPKDSWPVARAKFGLSRSLQNAYRIKDALEYSQAAKASLERIQAQPLDAPGRKYYSLEQHVEHILAHAVLLGSDNQFAAANQNLNDLRNILDEAQNDNEFLLAMVSYGEAQILSDTGDFIESVDIMETIYPTLVQHLGHSSGMVSEARWMMPWMLSQAHDSRAEPKARWAVKEATLELKPDDPALARTLETLGIILTNQDRKREAKQYFTRAVKIKSKALGPHHNSVLYAVNNLAMIEKQLGNYSVSEALHMQAYEGFLKVQGESRLITPLSLNHAGLMADLQGKEELALSRLSQSVALMDKLGTPRHSAIISGKNNYIQALFGTQDFESAKKIALEQKDISDILYPKHHYLNIGQEMVLQFASIKAGDVTEYSPDIYSRFIESVRKFTPLIDADSEAFNTGYFAEQGLALAVVKNDVGAAIQMADIIFDSELAKYTNLSAQRAMAQSSRLKALIRQRQDLEKDLNETDSKILEKHSSGESYLDIEHQFKDIENRLIDIDQSLKTEFPDWYESVKKDRINLEEIQQQLSSEEALIIPIYTRRFIHIIAITKDAARLETVAHNGGKTTADVKKLLSMSSKLTREAFPDDLSQSLYKNIFPKRIEDLIASKSHWSILPSGPFMSLNPALLQFPARRTETPSWVISSKAISIRTSLRGGKTPLSKRKNKTVFLGIGAAATGQDDDGKLDYAQLDSFSEFFGAGPVLLRGGETNVRSLKDLPALPRAIDELRQMKSNFPDPRSKLITGKAATESAIKSLNFEDFDIITFATHGFTTEDEVGNNQAALLLTPPEKASVLDDGLLTAEEIYELKLSADWVILSACHSAASGAKVDPPYTGLAQAFIYAGSKNLLVSHWPVRDDAAAFLTVNTVKNTQAGMSKAKALQKAMRDLRGNPDIPNADHPAIWAPFVLVGE